MASEGKNGNKWFERCPESDPRFLCRIEEARRSLREGRRIVVEDADSHLRSD